MRIIAMHKTNSDNEAGILPPQKLIDDMGELMGEMARAGIVRAGDGLRASSTGVRLNFTGGDRSVTPGPFKGNNELLESFSIVRVNEIGDAIAWASRYGEIVGDGEIDIRPVVEPWDLGIFPKPETVTTTRYMIAHKADARSEAGAPHAPAVAAAIEKLSAEMEEAGVLLKAVKMQPSAKGTRLHYREGKFSITDGPFTESKELIAGFVILELPSIEESLPWMERFATIVGDVEIDIRPLDDAGDEVAAELTNTEERPLAE